MTARWRQAWAGQDARWSVLLVVLFALAATATGLGNLFAYDDIPIIVENPMVTQLHSPLAYFTDSYWGPSRGNSLYRPLTVIAYALEWAVGKGSPLPFHLANVLLYVASAVAALMLFRLFLPKGAALVAGLAFAVHPVHVEAVANVVGQSEMLTAIPMLLAVIAYVRDRQQGPLRTRTVMVIAACCTWALLHKEHGIVLPALLLMTEIVFRGRGFPAPASGAAPQWMLARTLTLIVLAYIIVRLSILGGFAGDAPHPALEGVPMGRRLWVMLGLVPEFVRLYLWPARLHPDYSPQAVPFLDSPAMAHLPGAVLMLGALALFVHAWRRDRVIAFALLWTGLTMGPISNILIPTGVLVAERTLFLPSVGVMLLVGRAVELAWPHVVAYQAKWVRQAVPAVGGLLLVTATLHSAERQMVWADNPTLFSTMVVESPTNFRAHFALGELFGAAASWKRAEQHLRTADSLYPDYDLLELSLARVLHFDDRCPDAVPVYESVLRRRPDAEIALIGRTACLLELRRLSDARDESLRGIGRGLSVGAFGMMLQKAESSLVANDSVDARNRWARAGGPTSKSNARLRVPVLLMKPAASGGRRKVPASVPSSDPR
jgi:protein O-mannosyl-transferase